MTKKPYRTNTHQPSIHIFSRTHALGFALLLLTPLVTGCASRETQPPEEKVADFQTTPLAAPVIDVAPVNDFATCVQGLQRRAIESGVSEHTSNTVLANVQYVMKVIELDHKQPEYTETFGNYLNAHVTADRIKQGRKMLEQNETLFQSLEDEYGLPAQYLVAFWGLETNYGSYQGKMPVLNSLATLACSDRRADFFAGELFEALKLVDAEIVEPDQLVGSWAGAVGNMQFMPSTYRRFAIDADGNGKADLWHSVPDAMTSAANYLHKSGWHRGEKWGEEVELPADFDYSQTGLQQRKSLERWRSLQVTYADGRPLPENDKQAAILLPSGHSGPAFLVYPNFDVIMKWNRSEFYAISVGYLGDRINGEATLLHTPPPLPRLEIAKVKALQNALTAAGFDAGNADGVLGSGTRAAIRGFQKAQGMIADGYPSPEVFTALGIR